VLADTLLEDM